MYSRSYFSVFINSTSSHFEAAAFTVFLNVFGRCITPSVLVSIIIKSLLFFTIYTTNLSFPTTLRLVFVVLKKTTSGINVKK